MVSLLWIISQSELMMKNFVFGSSRFRSILFYKLCPMWTTLRVWSIESWQDLILIDHFQCFLLFLSLVSLIPLWPKYFQMFLLQLVLFDTENKKNSIKYFQRISNKKKFEFKFTVSTSIDFDVGNGIIEKWFVIWKILVFDRRTSIFGIFPAIFHLEEKFISETKSMKKKFFLLRRQLCIIIIKTFINV